MSTACLPLFAPISPSIATKKLTQKKISPFNATARKLYGNSMTCKAAAAASSSSSIMDFDLYDLLGVDSSSHQSQIKLAYRTLQKRCHPDIAGPAGHDMAIILNDVYSILSDPNLRSAYDKEGVRGGANDWGGPRIDGRVRKEWKAEVREGHPPQIGRISVK